MLKGMKRCMNKILITVYVISIDESFDLLLPAGKKVGDILDLIQDAIVDLSNNNYIRRDDILLYSDDGLIINPNNIVKYSGLKNGCKVCIV